MASPITNQPQQTWVPYETAKDCSQGFCSIYCPQWCYIIFPPPPPFSFVGDDSSASTTFSPIVIAIIGILASAFLLVTYYTVISKYCGGFGHCPRHRRQTSNPLGSGDPVVNDDAGNGLYRHDTWHVPPSTGLDEALISKISVYKYRRREGLVDGTDCSVCLGEFREDESLRLLPKCSHAFHMQCIDTWLRSHSNCPLCRANIVASGHVEAEVEQRNVETVVVIEGAAEEEAAAAASLENHGDVPKENSEIIEVQDDDDDDEGVQWPRRSLLVDSLNKRRVSIADILQLSMEDEFRVASRNGKGSGQRKNRSLHSVMSPVPMKRSVSSGRLGLGFARQAKGRSSVLPL